jgi:hypothetical protein
LCWKPLPTFSSRHLYYKVENYLATNRKPLSVYYTLRKKYMINCKKNHTQRNICFLSCCYHYWDYVYDWATRDQLKKKLKVETPDYIVYAGKKNSVHRTRFCLAIAWLILQQQIGCLAHLEHFVPPTFYSLFYA